MTHPVTHFEVNARDAKAMQRFYSDVFGWRIDTNNPMNYGVVDTRAEGHGIGGGIGATQSDRSWITFYVESPDLAQTLARVERLGGRTVMQPNEMGGVTFALFSDPEGNVIGLAKSGASTPERPRRATAVRGSAGTKKTAARRSSGAKRVTRKTAPKRTASSARGRKR